MRTNVQFKQGEAGQSAQGMTSHTLRQFLELPGATQRQGEDVAKVVGQLADAAARVAAAVADGSRNAAFANEGAVNVQGETQKFLDVLAHNLFMAAAREAGVNCLLSEEEEEAVALNPEGTIALAIDPLDGSSNIAINGPIGTIFGLYPALNGDIPAQFLRPGRDLLAAAYIVYGPRTELVLSLGTGTKKFVLNGDRSEWIFAADCSVPDSACEFAINASNHRHWTNKVRTFVNNCLDGKHGPYGADYNMRWLAALVGETHRILTRGGLFIYPEDSRNGYENGRLRYCYECAPISFLIENAGGKATDGTTPILDMTPASLHARVPFCFGSPRQMAHFEKVIETLIEHTSPLFSDRGFFRTRV
jgi:fructose-1,6-bisphosphatase I